MFVIFIPLFTAQNEQSSRECANAPTANVCCRRIRGSRKFDFQPTRLHVWLYAAAAFAALAQVLKFEGGSETAFGFRVNQHIIVMP